MGYKNQKIKFRSMKEIIYSQKERVKLKNALETLKEAVMSH